MQPNIVKKLIESGIPHCEAIVKGDDGVHFEATIISDAFVGKNRIQKQQLVYQTLRDKIADGSLHAISMKTFTTDEWQQQENK